MYRSNFPDKAFIDNLLLRCSVPPQTQGFDFLSEAIYLYATGHYKNISEIYAEIGANIPKARYTVTQIIP